MARSNYLAAAILYKEAKQDKYLLATTCYHIQQCMEQCLKIVLEQEGEPCKLDCGVGFLCSRAKSICGNGDLVEVVGDISKEATIYTMWGTCSKCVASFEQQDKIEEALLLCDKLLNIIKE